VKKLLIFLAAMLALQLVSAAPPWVNNASILPVPAYMNSSLQGWCNVSDNDTALIAVNYTWYNGSAVYLTGENLSGGTSAFCNQESANVSTDCGGLAIGNYSFDGGPANGKYMWINYSIPQNALGASWQVKNNQTNLFNVSIPTSCWLKSTSVLQLRVTLQLLSGIASQTRQECYNGSSWESIGTVASGPISCGGPGQTSTNLADGDWSTGICTDGAIWRSCGAEMAFYEEAIFWNLSYIANNTNTLVSTLPANTAHKWENWTFRCIARDNVSYSINSYNSSINISSAPPVISSAMINNSPIFLGQTAIANWTFSDIDGDTDTSFYRWYLNGSINHQGQFSGAVPNFSNFNASGDTLVLSVLGNDATVNSTVWVNSSTYTVQDPGLNMTVNSLTAFNQTMGKNKTLSFMLSLINNASTTLLFNITDNRNTTFLPNLSFNTTLFNVTGTSATALNITINSSNITGTQFFNLTVIRQIDKRNFTLLVGITVVSQSASLSFTPTALWTSSAYTTTGLSKKFNVTNADYNASNCSFSTPGPINAYVEAHSFSISAETKEITLNILNPAVDVYAGTFTLTCSNATDTGASVTAPVGVDYLFIVQAPYTPSGGGGGGGSTSTSKKACFIKLSKETLTVSDDTKIDTLYIKNSEAVAYIPSVVLSDSIKEYVRYTLAPSIIRADESGELSILMSASNISLLGQITLVDAACEDITIPVALNSGGKITFFLLDYLLKPLFSISGITVYNWYVLVVSMIVLFLSIDALKPKMPLGTKWAAALALAGVILALINIVVVKGWISSALS
jgi:hypothetical protein